MASKTRSVKQGKAYTPPKGRATVHNTGEAKAKRLSPTMEWIIAAIVFVIVLGSIFYFGADFRSGGTGQSGAELLVPLEAVSFR